MDCHPKLTYKEAASPVYVGSLCVVYFRVRRCIHYLSSQSESIYSHVTLDKLFLSQKTLKDSLLPHGYASNTNKYVGYRPIQSAAPQLYRNLSSC